MSLSPTGRQFVPTYKTRLFLWLYRVFGTWSQWFVTHCDTEPFNLEGLLTEEEIEEFGETFLKNVDKELGIECDGSHTSNEEVIRELGSKEVN